MTDLNEKTAKLPEEHKNRARANFLLKQFIAPAIRLFAEKNQGDGMFLSSLFSLANKFSFQF